VVLIITNKQDIHPTPIIERFIGANIPYFRFNTECLLSEYDIQYWDNSEDADFIIRNRETGKECHGSWITAIWDRRPMTPSEVLFNNSDEIDKLNLKEATEFLMYLRYSLKDIPSIGSILYDRAASSKILQARIAREVGFFTPDTLFTNNADAAKLFAKKHTTVAIKEMSGYSVIDADSNSEYIFWTQKISSHQIESEPKESFSQSINFFQCYIKKKYELRVTVVGDNVYSCRIDSQRSHDGIIDWRLAQSDNNIFSAYTVCDAIKEKCLNYLQRLGLSFGCFDFIVTPDDNLIFLECNPNGQWLWIELATGLHISDGIYDFLTKEETECANQNN